MGALAEYVLKEAEQLKKEIHNREEAVKEWSAAIKRLYGQIEQWVNEADGGTGLLRSARMPRPTFQEPRLGVYELDCLQIAIGSVASGSRRAEVRPRARHVSASIRPPGKEPRRADGIVEIRSGSVPEYYLFRLNEADGDHWYIQSDARWHADPLNNDVEELNSDRFEAALLRVLQ